MSQELREQGDEWLRDVHVGQLLKIHRTTVWDWAKQGRIPQPERIFGNPRWSRRKLEAALAQKS